MLLGSTSNCFKTKVCKIHGKNVTAAEKEIVAFCLLSNEVGVLPYESDIDVFTGLTNCSMPDFVKMFDFSCSKSRQKLLTLILMKKSHLSRLKPF